MAANYVQVLNGILRGKALDIIDDLTVVPDLQESLRLSSSVSLLEEWRQGDIASILLTSPDRRAGKWGDVDMFMHPHGH